MGSERKLQGGSCALLACELENGNASAGIRAQVNSVARSGERQQSAAAQIYQFCLGCLTLDG